MPCRFSHVEPTRTFLYPALQLTGFAEDQVSNESRILPTVSHSGLEALAKVVLAPSTQSRLDELLHRNSDGRLSNQESLELDTLLEQVDELNLLKARAEYTLRHQEQADDS